MSTGPVRTSNRGRGAASRAAAFTSHTIPASGQPIVVVGVSGTEASSAAVERAAEIAGPAGKVVLVSAIRRSRRPAGSAYGDRGSVNALGSDAYLLGGEATLDEMQRVARETVKRAGPASMEEFVRCGSPDVVLLHACAEFGATNLVLGSLRKPSWLARRLARKAAVSPIVVVYEPRSVVDMAEWSPPRHWYWPFSGNLRDKSDRRENCAGQGYVTPVVPRVVH